MTRLNVKCPYCNARAVRRPARDIIGSAARDYDAYLWVCSRYPACNSYVSAHKKSGLPMGVLADPSLRRKRIQAHRAFNQLWQQGPFTKQQAYRWLQGALGLDEEQAHIAQFSHCMCDKVISLCSDDHPHNLAA